MSEWIPCSERLPQGSKPVLITILWSKYQDLEVSIGEYWEKTEGWGEFAMGDITGEVIAWKPLDEPYDPKK